ncbi:MAG: orotidine-5'-phosphate decarboxylase [Calditrichia bacterium]
MSFFKKLNSIIHRKKSFLCVGLDSDIEKIPDGLEKSAQGVLEFNKAIIEATSEFAVAYKINIAFYESLGIKGWEVLEKTLMEIPSDIISIADAKRGDIGNTSRHYAKTFFDTYSFDAITVAPYMGFDSVAPFAEYRDKGVFVLCLTSNKGSGDFQYLKIDDSPLYMHVARRIKEWNQYDNLGIVAGATHPTELADLRTILPDVPFLIPGVGAQGGDLEAVLKNSLTVNKDSILINSSRGIIFASKGNDFAQEARKRAEDLVNQMRTLSNL